MLYLLQRGMHMNGKKTKIALLCGMVGCALMGAGDWLMLYGDPTATGAAYWLTEGAAKIPAWRNALSMALAFPAVIFYGVGLFAIGTFLRGERQRKTWFAMTAFGMTPWLCVHLFVAGALYLFAWLRNSAWTVAALPAAEAFRSQFLWVVFLSYPLMLPPYFYWAWQLFKGKSAFPRWMTLSSPITFYLVLKGFSLRMPIGAFRIAFTNGLMSEAMFLWFFSMLLWSSSKGEGSK